MFFFKSNSLNSQGIVIGKSKTGKTKQKITKYNLKNLHLNFFSVGPVATTYFCAPITSSKANPEQ